MRVEGGLLLSIDGLDGSGKGTQTKALAAALRDFCQLDTYVIPSLDEVGFSGTVRKQVLEDSGAEMDPLTRQVFIAAAYMHTYHTRVAPALAEGSVVILDRTVQLSTIPYAVADNVNREAAFNVRNLVELTTRQPDLGFVLDVSYETAQTRMRARGSAQEVTHFDRCSPEKFELRRETMLHLAQYYPWASVVSAEQTPFEIFCQLYHSVDQRLHECTLFVETSVAAARHALDELYNYAERCLRGGMS